MPELLLCWEEPWLFPSCHYCGWATKTPLLSSLISRSLCFAVLLWAGGVFWRLWVSFQQFSQREQKTFLQKWSITKCSPPECDWLPLLNIHRCGWVRISLQSTQYTFMFGAFYVWKMLLALNSSSHPLPHRTISSLLSSCWEQLSALFCCARCSCSSQQHHWSNLGYPSVKTRRLSWFAGVPLVIIKHVMGLRDILVWGNDWWARQGARQREPSSSASWGCCHPRAQNHQWLLTRRFCEGFKAGIRPDTMWVLKRGHPAASVCVRTDCLGIVANEEASFCLWSAFTSFTSNSRPLFSSCNILLVLGEGRTSTYL